jgi:hypothetical protein
VIVQVFIAQRQPVDALRQHRFYSVLDALRIAAIGETRRHPPQQFDLAIRFAQQQSPAVSRYLAGGKPGFHSARKMGCKRERFLVTRCHQKGRLRTAITTYRQRSYARKGRPFQHFFYLSSPQSAMRP